MANLGQGVHGTFLTPQGWVKGEINWDEKGCLTSVEGKKTDIPEADDERIVSGFVDLHVHGGNGADAMEGEESIRTMARFHASCGTVALAPTTMTARAEEIGLALSGIQSVRNNPGANEAKVVGAHLEGPFLNKNRLGAQPDHAIAYDQDLVEDWLGRARIAVATVAPEIEGGSDLIKHLAQSGCKVQIGHSEATAEMVAAVLRSGISGFTHFYNAMPPFKHRDEGLVGQALALASHAELICDFQHVGVVALRVACRAIPNAYAITDSTAAAGMPDGEYPLGPTKVTKKGSTMRTKEGGLAGTAMTMFDARQNLIAAGFGEQEAQAMVSSRPAAYLGFSELGSIEVGKSASLVRISQGRVNGVWLSGKQV